jgi:hypothetical protein
VRARAQTLPRSVVSPRRARSKSTKLSVRNFLYDYILFFSRRVGTSPVIASITMVAAPLLTLAVVTFNAGGTGSSRAGFLTRHAAPRAGGPLEWIARALGNEFKPCRTMFIAALGDPQATAGMGAQDWGLWRIDPGPPGVYLKDFESDLEATNGVAPSGWKFDYADWWVEEYGRIMEPPSFPIPAGRYIVTGDREVTTVLTIASDGSWSLAKGCLYDVTHLPCRAARYKGGSPANARPTDFPVTPGAAMPEITGCSSKQDYAVVFVTGVEIDWE